MCQKKQSPASVKNQEHFNSRITRADSTLWDVKRTLKKYWHVEPSEEDLYSVLPQAERNVAIVFLASSLRLAHFVGKSLVL